MIANGIRRILKRIAKLTIAPAEPWTYGPLRDQEKDLAWTLEQNEKLRQALGAQGE